MRPQLYVLLVLLSASTAQKLTKKENALFRKSCGRPDALSDNNNNNNNLYMVQNGPVADRSAEAPWAILFEGTSPIDGPLHCTGSLISDRHVLIAAHCVSESLVDCDRKNPRNSGFDLDLMKVNVQDSCENRELCQKGSVSNVTYNVAKVFVPSNYVSMTCWVDGTFRSDIAVLELTTPVPVSNTLYPVCLADSTPKIGTKVDMFGYGADYFGMGPRDYNSGILKHHQTCVHVNEDTYEADNGVDYLFTESNTTTLACMGDSGAGMMIDVNRKTTVAGVLFTEPACRVVISEFVRQQYNIESVEWTRGEPIRGSSVDSWNIPWLFWNDSVLKIGTKLDMFGYGIDFYLQIFEGPKSGILKHHITYAHNLESKYNYYESWKNATDYMFTESNSTTEACEGDSGSGMMVNVNGRTTVGGVLIGGHECSTVLTKPYYDVSIAVVNHLPWICRSTGICIQAKDQVRQQLHYNTQLY